MSLTNSEHIFPTYFCSVLKRKAFIKCLLCIQMVSLGAKQGLRRCWSLFRCKGRERGALVLPDTESGKVRE